MQIGFIGLGNMGAGIAANLIRAGHGVAVWNRTPDKARRLIEAGAELVASPLGRGRMRQADLTEHAPARHLLRWPEPSVEGPTTKITNSTNWGSLRRHVRSPVLLWTRA